MTAIAARVQSRTARDFTDNITFSLPVVPAPAFPPQKTPVQEPPLADAPVHCGQAMTLADVSLRLPIVTFAAEEPRPASRREWVCGCGFRQDPVPGRQASVRRVWLAAAQVEDRQWALDQAIANLNASIRAAVGEGCPLESVASAAGLTVQEVWDILRQDAGMNAA